MKVINGVLIGLGAVLILAAVWFIFGWRKGNRAETIGWLSDTKHVANMYTKRRFYKHYVHYAYVYRVNDREYTYKNGAGGTRTELPIKIKIVYQKTHPSIGCPKYVQNVYIALALLVAIVAALCLVLPGLMCLLKM